MPTAQNLEGDLRDVALPQVLKTLAVQQSTGILTVQGEEDIVAVSCLNGHIVTADSLNHTQEESLGALLVNEDLVSKEALASVAAEHQTSGTALSDLLISLGLITRDKLLQCLRLQTYRLMLQVLTWRQGEFRFYGGDEVSYEKGVTPITVDEMLIRALADLGEVSGVGGEVPRLDAIYRQVPPRGPIRVFRRDGAGGPGIWLTELQQAFLEKMDGRTSAYDVARALRAGRFRTLFSLHQLLQNDLIELAQAAPGRAATARPATARAATGGAATGRASAGRAAPGGGTAQLPAVAAPSATVPRPAPLAPPVAAAIPATVAQPAPIALAPPAPRPAPQPASGVRATEPRREAHDRPVVAAAAPGTPRFWIGTCLAAVLLLVTLFALASGPSSFLLPFPWQRSQREALERQIRQTLFRKLDRAIGTHYLMEFQYPRGLDDLVDRRLLAATDTWDAAGQALRYVPQDQSYLIELVAAGRTVETRGGSITGDFILDRDYFSEEVVKNPLVLLD
ncbi:MAG TPA: DUF4388 domain-containing protein [Thermoanaerobaculia bacterium]|jgi:hypothetical protein